MYEDKVIGPDDIFLWPDNTWCYRDEFWEMSHMSDDYEILVFGSFEYDDFFVNTD